MVSVDASVVVSTTLAVSAVLDECTILAVSVALVACRAITPVAAMERRERTTNGENFIV